MKVCRCESAFSFFFFKQSLFDHGNSCCSAGSKVRCSLITVFYHSSLLYLTYNIYLHHTGLLPKVQSKLQTFIKLCSLVNNKINHFYFLKLCFQLIYPVFIFCIQQFGFLFLHFLAWSLDWHIKNTRISFPFSRRY